ncbi:Crp/Fnr family transcriptional regulator [Peptostreptococcus equinus]|uniref:Crp/Fnr family transcriptional regulator n=1 Tax=Peptostreptococcus equinus TaxID=3003601 RepID=A0ABY7JR34_9FIRM|nr:Crp/Fnr family transcriptional regulator [Peptostreptococcus sp. CBA3647]WAW14508.1 Crp/Fnr family transcriptional regulator [Peptostreptococcus sp. CBA3647]
MIDYTCIKVFEGLKKETLDKVALCSDIIKLKKNQCLYTDGQELKYVYFLLSGKITLSKPNENGESRIIFILTPGDTINQPIMRKNTSAVECWGFEDSKILRITFEEFDRLMSQDYNLSRNCMIFMEKRIRRLYRQLKNGVLGNLDKKLAAKLYRLGIEHGIKSNDQMTKIDLKITITYLAKMIGCQRESLSRSIKYLSSLDIMKYEDKYFYVDMKKANRFFKTSEKL